MAESSNFAFLKEHDPVFLPLASAVERVCASDPNTPLIRLLQLGEALGQGLANHAGIELRSQTTQDDFLYKLRLEIRCDRSIVTQRQARHKGLGMNTPSNP